MGAPLSSACRRLLTSLLIVTFLFSLLADPITTWARTLSIPSKCSGGNFTLFSGEGTITIENPVPSNVSFIGCDIRGSMRVQIRGNDKGNIYITGFVDAYNNFTSTSIGEFNLQIAGLTLVVKASTYALDTLYLTQPWIKIPDSWGGLEAPIPQTMKINAAGLEVISFKLPSLESAKGFKLDLEGSLGLVSGGYQIQAMGTLGLPDIGKTKDCGITVAVTLVADVFGQAVMFIHTLDGAEAVTSGSGSSTIASAAEKPALAPAALALTSFYLPVPDTLPYEVYVQIQNRTAPPEAEDQSIAAPILDAAYGPPAGSSALPESSSPAQTAGELLPAAAPADPAPGDLSAYYDNLPWPQEDQMQSPLGVGVIVTASAHCDKGIPIDGTGFELTGVEGTLSLRPESEFVRLKIIFQSSLKVANIAALTLDSTAMFQWEPEFAMSLTGRMTVLEMFPVYEATVSVSESDGFRTTVIWNSWFIKANISIHAWNTTTAYCKAWESWCYYPYPLPPICGTACSDWGYRDKFHFTGSASAKVGIAEGELWSGCILPYPCNWRWCRKWFIYYPCCSLCWACIDIPPFDIWLLGAGAEFGEFTGDRYGLKGYVSFLGFTTGFYVDHTGDFDLGDVSSYRLVDSVQLAQAREAWMAAELGASSVPLDDTFTFLADDRVLVNFELPMSESYAVPLAPSDLISSVKVITQTDTIFSVKTDIPLTVTLVSPNGVEITPDNYSTNPGGYVVEYTRVMSYEQILESSEEAALKETRWSFVHASGAPYYPAVDVILDGTPVYTDVSLVDVSSTYTEEVRYIPVEPGIHLLEVHPSYEWAPILTANLSIVTGTDTTVMMVGDWDAELVVLNDDNLPPASYGKGKLRVVNAATNASTMDAALGDITIPNLAYKSASDYLEVPAGSYSLTLTSPDFNPLFAISLTGELNSMVYGIKVASAGDVNGDGFDDVLVADNAFDNERGKVYLYHGSPAGLEAEPAWTMEGENEAAQYDPGDQFGSGIASAGDVNGDGYDDVVITAPEYEWVEGKAYLYLGSANGLGETPAWTRPGVEYEYYFYSTAGAGDVNGDGYDDVLFGHPEIGDFSMGEAYLFYGSANGLSDQPGWSMNGWGEPLNAAEFGKVLAGAGDVNGDGYDDIVIGAPPGTWSGETDLGKAFLFLGSASGPATSPDWVVQGENRASQFALALDGVGDINGDGYDDVVVGAPFYANDAINEGGKIYAYQGSPAGLSPTPDWTYVHTGSPSHFGNAISGAGDVNGDGLDDFLVGSYTNPYIYSMNAGQISLFHGSSSGAYWQRIWYAYGDATDDYFGISVDGAGDVNGDGNADLIAGAIGNKGRAEVYQGGMGRLPAPVIVEEGDIQTYFAANLSPSAPLDLMYTSDQVYRVVTETRYVVDQATTGTWSVSLEGETEAATNLTVGAVTAHHPPIVEDLHLNASNLSETLVSWRLMSDYLPVTISIFANDGPITQTMVITDPLPAEETIPVFQGIQVASIPISDSLAVKNAVVSTTVDLSFLESGNYRLWVRVEDGVSPPVQGYVWYEPTLASSRIPAALNRVRVAAEGYDSLAQTSGAGEILIDHSASFGTSWTSTITPTINPKFLTLNDQGQIEEAVIDGLFVEFTPYDHPDVDSYFLEISGLGETRVITAGNTTYYHYNEYEEPVGAPVNYAIFNGLNPKTGYTIRLGARDIDSGQVAWTPDYPVDVPIGDFELSAIDDEISIAEGQESVTVTLQLTMSADLFSNVSFYVDGKFLPPGISVERITYQTVEGMLGSGSAGIPSPAYLPVRLNGSTGIKAESAAATVLVHLALSLPGDLPAASYMLPIVAYSGELVDSVPVRLESASVQAILVDPNASQPLIVDASLPLPTCATALRATIMPGTFLVPTLLEFDQTTSNVTNWERGRFALVRFVLANSGAALIPLKPISIQITYDPACLGGLYEDGLTLFKWSSTPLDPVTSGWSDEGIACLPDPENNQLNCSLGVLGEFAMFEPVLLYLPEIED